jgi:tRNA nucleotidyltransferase (CCA-adding enzyme)
MGLIQKLGGHRFFHELQHILMEEDPTPAVRRMAEFGVLPVLYSNMRFDPPKEELFARIREVVSWHRLSFLDEPLDRWWVYLLGLLSDISPRQLSEVWERLEMNEKLRERILWLYYHMEELLQGFFLLPDRRPSDIYRALQPFRPEELLFIMAKTRNENVRRAISHYFHRYRSTRTELLGKDLKAMGIPPGPIYRIILERILDARLNGEVRNRQEELEFVQREFPELFEGGTEHGSSAASS